MRPALLAMLVTAAACGPRQAHPYHFRSPLLGSVRAAELPWAAAQPDARQRTPEAGEGTQEAGRSTPARVAVARRPMMTQAPSPVRQPPAPRGRRSIPSDALARASGEDLAARLRAMVGRRDDSSTHLALALAALREAGATLDPELARVEDGPALVALAERRGALSPAAAGSPLPSLRLGDLLVFDRVVAADPASLVAVVVSVDERGVVEFVYLARGVVRRGFVFSPEPSTRRDASGRVLNTFVRHNDGGDPRGTAHLAGELIAAAISLDRLLR